MPIYKFWVYRPYQMTQVGNFRIEAKDSSDARDRFYEMEEDDITSHIEEWLPSEDMGTSSDWRIEAIEIEET